MSSKTILDSPLAGVATNIKERRCNLIGRHGELRNKITTMESSITALMAYNMWMADRNCHDTLYCKMQEIMKKFLPQPGPADKLLDELNTTINNIYQETAELHDKIINTDVELEEAGMELESLELANKELEQNLTKLQQEIQKYKTPSLHSIHSEDLRCLKKIRQLAEEELKLKTCIKELENKEDTYRQVGKLLSCRELQRDSKKTAECTRKVKGSGKKLQCSLDVYKYNMTKQIYALKDEGKQICCPCTMSITDCEETSKRTKAREQLCPSLPCCVSLDIHGASRTAMSKSCEKNICCKHCRQTSGITLKLKSSYLMNRPCEFPLSLASGVPQSSKQVIRSSVLCEPGKSCDECETAAAACKRVNSRKCDCERICARRLPTLPCDCSVIPLTYHSTEVDDSDSDEEFCECCSCESSENSL